VSFVVFHGSADLPLLQDGSSDLGRGGVWGHYSFPWQPPWLPSGFLLPPPAISEFLARPVQTFWAGRQALVTLCSGLCLEKRMKKLCYILKFKCLTRRRCSILVELALWTQKMHCNMKVLFAYFYLKNQTWWCTTLGYSVAHNFQVLSPCVYPPLDTTAECQLGKLVREEKTPCLLGTWRARRAGAGSSRPGTRGRGSQ
jgi:hypothetical protein